MNTQRRSAREAIDGVLLLDKPVGLSSNAALQRAKRALNAAKAGHTGTLDPLASGLLPLCFGEATKFAQALLDAPKRYTATIRFGSTTTTGDAEGEVLETRPVDLTARADRGGAARVSSARSSRCRRPSPRSSTRAATTTSTPAPAWTIPRVARSVEIHALALVAWNPPDAVRRRRLQQGNLCAGAGRGPGRRARHRRAPGGAAAHDDRRDSPSRMRSTLDAFEALPLRNGGHACSPWMRRWRICRGSISMRRRRATCCRGGRLPASVAAGRCRAYGPEGRFLGLVDGAAGRLRAVRLVATQSHRATRVPDDADVDA